MYTYECKVLNVVDGDTIDIEIDLGFTVRIKERVRLIGVDTPEVFGPNAVPEGSLASEFTKKWVAEHQARAGRFVYESKKYNARDKYGRSLGVIYWTNGSMIKEDLNSALIDSGNIKK